MSHEIILCEDGMTRAVEVVNGTPIDPSLGSLKKAREEAVKEVKKEKPKVSIQDRINEQVSGYIGEIGRAPRLNSSH